MRFIGNKEKLLDNIYQAVQSTGINTGVFCDFFSGTSNVGRYFKEKGYSIISSDVLYFSYVLQKAYIENNKRPTFKKLLKNINYQKNTLFDSPLEIIISHLNKLNGQKGFIYKNYTEDGTKNLPFRRKFFTFSNAMKIDVIRQVIEKWKDEKIISEAEYYILIACLIESVPFYANISGVYAAFLKNYDPRALKRFRIKPIRIYCSKDKHQVYNKNSIDLLEKIDVDVLYLDPPYNERQYGANYHLLETISKYDNPKIKGVTGMRDYSMQKSEFCNEKTALIALEKIAKESKYQYLILSYNSEGIMRKEDIIKILNKFGRVKLIEMDYTRFKSNSNGSSKHKKMVREQLYILSAK